MLVFGETHKFGVPAGQVCDCVCLFAASTLLDQLVSGGPMEWIRGPGIQAGVLGGQRSHAGAWGIHKCVCAFTSKRQSLPAKEKEGELAVMSLLETLHVGADEGSALPMAVCVASHAHVLSVCVSLGYSLALLLVKPVNRKAAAMSISLGWRPLGFRATRTGLQQPRKRNRQALELLEAVAACNIP